MYLKSLELSGFKSFAKKTTLSFTTPVTAIVGPNGSGKSNCAEAFRFALGEQSMKSMRGKRGEDLLWNGSRSVARANRASVKIMLDNERRLLPVDFDEVVIERILLRDGSHQYLLNGSVVRLRDVIAALSAVHIGASSHHIISQGEADRILNCSIKERRAMIEDALGLKIFQYKKQESEKKLEKTQENISQVVSLRKEIAPHLRFLKKQMEKIERARSLRDELREFYRAYFAREEAYLSAAAAAITQECKEPVERLNALKQEGEAARQALEVKIGSHMLESEARAAEEIRSIRAERAAREREVGRIEGMIELLEGTEKERPGVLPSLERRMVPFVAVEEFTRALDARLGEVESYEDLGALRALLSRIRKAAQLFLDQYRGQREETMEGVLGVGAADHNEKLESLRAEKSHLESESARLRAAEQAAEEAYRQLREKIEHEQEANRDAEHALLKITAEEERLTMFLRDFARREEERAAEEASFKQELTEAAILMGREVLVYERPASSNASTIKMEAVADRNAQRELRKKIEHLKIRLEEARGASGDDIEREYTEAMERDAFLEREVNDLEQSRTALEALIHDLEARLDTKFREGVERINDAFQKFFALQFSGGHAALMMVQPPSRRSKVALPNDTDDEDEVSSGEEIGSVESAPEAGIEVEISLPHKRVKGIEQLSGGERVLTSIALIFAVSQVNPPPFLILDETDAALDEANSRRYGDMIEDLSKRSQLILITHNRETMSRAGVLYGITMGGDGVSQVLSVKLDEAVAAAKQG